MAADRWEHSIRIERITDAVADPDHEQHAPDSRFDHTP
jgi:hypothetical protein